MSKKSKKRGRVASAGEMKGPEVKKARVEETLSPKVKIEKQESSSPLGSRFTYKKKSLEEDDESKPDKVKTEKIKVEVEEVKEDMKKKTGRTNEVKSPLFPNSERAVSLKEFTCKIQDSSVTGPIDAHVTIVATPSLRKHWQLAINLQKASTASQAPRIEKQPEPVFDSRDDLKKHIKGLVDVFGAKPNIKKFWHSYGEDYQTLHTHFRVLTAGGLSMLDGRKQWAHMIKEAKLNDGLFGPLRVYVCVGNGRLMCDGTVVEF